MALINCSECNKEVSDKASACPHCGCPITAMTSITKSEKVQKVEMTGKQFKGAYIIFVIIGFFGFCMMIAANGDKSLGMFGVVMLAIGVIGFLISRIAAWWSHG